jgi:hypothetical protein
MVKAPIAASLCSDCFHSAGIVHTAHFNSRNARCISLCTEHIDDRMRRVIVLFDSLLISLLIAIPSPKLNALPSRCEMRVPARTERRVVIER